MNMNLAVDLYSVLTWAPDNLLAPIVVGLVLLKVERSLCLKKMLQVTNW